MIRETIPAWYGEAEPDGSWAALIPDRHVLTNAGIVPLCPGGNTLFLRKRGIRLACQGGNDDDRSNYEWDGAGWHPIGGSYGVSPVAFAPDGSIVQGSVAFGSQGIRWIDEAGVHTGDATYVAPAPVSLYQYTTHGDVTIGQGPNGGVMAVTPEGRRVLVEAPAYCTDVRFNRVGEAMAVAIVIRGGLILLWFTRPELNTFPLEVIAAPPPVVIPPTPEPPPVALTYRDESDILPYLKRRWSELGIPPKVKAICERYRILTNKEMTRIREKGNAEERARKEKCYDALRAVQIPAFFQIVGELYASGMLDVGLGRKTSGNNWENKATDIIVLKPIDANGRVVSGQVLQVDGLSGSGYPEAKPMWDEIPFNKERTWVEPSAGGVTPPPPPPDPEPRPDPALLARIAALEAGVRRLEAENAKLRETPAHPSYDAMMQMVEAVAEANSRLGGATYAHFTWRFLLEGYTVDQLVQDARERA